MKLVPVTGVLAAVAKAEEISPQAARTLVTLGLYESLSEQIDDARYYLEPMALVHMDRVAKRARAHLLREHVGKALSGQPEPADLDVAEGLRIIDEYVEKGLVGWIRRQFEEDHPRGKDGRFIRADIGTHDPNIKGGPTRQNSAAMHAGEQVSRWMDAKLINEKTPIKMHVTRYSSTGRAGTEIEDGPVTTGEKLLDTINELYAENPDLVISGLSIQRKDLPVNPGNQRAAVDLMAGVMGSPPGGKRVGSALPFGPDGRVQDQSENARRWHGASGSNGQPTDRQGYRRLAMTGETLQRISAPGSTVSTVGGLAQLVGDLGPEAEKVLGPGIRRTAYRYRGTERRPDAAAGRYIAQASANADALSDGGQVNVDPKRAKTDPIMAITGQYTSRSISEDKRALSMRGDAGVAYMLGVGQRPGSSHLASREETELSLESGEVPPSEGLLIDGNGHLASQAIGYNGDHYLPFDLKNLHRLFGGQYVRTRANGGPTTEDIYTGLMTGARQIQVVSNSGVFTVEFDPDLRGGRRFSDKAKRMVERYGSMLEAIAGKTLYQQDLSPEVMSELRQSAAEGATSEDEYRENLRILTERARMKGSLADDDDNELEAAAESHAKSKADREFESRRGTSTEMSRQEYKALIDEEKTKYKHSHGPSVRRLKLDGPGYERALRTLKQEFPYYIRTATYEPLTDWLRSRGLPNEQGHRNDFSNDRGQVKPGQTNPNLPGNNELSEAKARNRKVPTRFGGGTDSEPDQGGSGDGATTARTTSATRTAAEVTAAAAEQTVDPIAAMKRANSPYQRQVHQAVRDSLAVLNMGAEPLKGPFVPPSKEHYDEDVAAMQPDEFVSFKLQEFQDKHGSTGMTKFTEWLVNADENTQWRVLQSKDRILKGMAPLEEIPGYSIAEVEKGYAKLEELLKLLHPFHVPEDPENYELEAPNELDLKPLAYDDIPVGKPAEFYAHLASQMKIHEEPTYEAYKEIKASDDKTVAAHIGSRIEDFAYAKKDDKAPIRAEILAFQRGWTLAVAERTSAKMMQLAGAGSDAGPKDPSRDQVGKSARPRRVLVFHNVENSHVEKWHARR